MEFTTRDDARRYIDSFEAHLQWDYDDPLPYHVFDMKTHTDWSPAQPGEEFVDIDYRSNVVYEPEAEWTIQNLLAVRAGGLVLEVSGWTGDVDLDGRQGEVVGDARWQQSEQLMDGMLASTVTPQSQ